MPTILREQIDLSEAAFDADNRVLRNVRLIAAGMSLNRRQYSEEVLQKAAPLFEGVKAYDNHQSGSRPVSSLTGWYKDVRYERGALYADRYFSNTQAGRDVKSIAEDIVSGNAPKTLAGLSINAIGTGKTQKSDAGDVLVVESITRAESVDDVTNPAAGGLYRESDNGDTLASALVEAMTIEEYTAARPDVIERLHKEWKNSRDGEAVKAAKADADQHRAALEEAQATNVRLLAERDAAVRDAAQARRELMVEQALNDPKVKLPASWKTDLRARLLESDPATWGTLLSSEIKKASTADAQRVPITGAGQQVSPAVVTEATPAQHPPNWNEILSSPEAFAAWQRQNAR